MQKHEGAEVEVFPILGKAAAAVQPCDRPFNDPTLGQFHEALHLIGSLDDLDFETRQDFGDGAGENRPLISAIGEKLLEKGKPAKQRRQQRDAAVAILNTAGVNDGSQQQTLRVYEKMALLALDFFPRVEPVRINRGPPFSALFTLWLSMMAAVGLASRSSCSRHFSWSES